LTASTLAGAAMAVPVGRWLDRHGGRGLMTAGSIAATGLLVAWSHVHTVAGLYAVLVGVGLTSAMVLYEAAFAVVGDLVPPRSPGRCSRSPSWPASPAPSSCR
jgi:MFS family permease